MLLGVVDHSDALLTFLVLSRCGEGGVERRVRRREQENENLPCHFSRLYLAKRKFCSRFGSFGSHGQRFLLAVGFSAPMSTTTQTAR